MRICHAREQYVHWLRVAKDLSPHTLRAYDGDLTAFERHVGAETVVGRIDRDCFVAFIEQQRAAGLSAVSMKRRASALRGFCKWLVARDLLNADPFVGAAFVIGRSRTLPRILPGHELDRLFGSLRRMAGVRSSRDLEGAVARPHECTTLLGVALMVATGVRVNELVSIEHQNVDLPTRSVRLVGKGRRERQVFLTNDWITELTRAYLRTRAALHLPHPYLLFNLRHGPLTPSAMRSRVAKAARAAGLRMRVTPHMLRHTAATQLIEAGVDIRYIQRLLGHASLSTTEIYTHVSDSALRRVVSDADVLKGLIKVR